MKQLGPPGLTKAGLARVCESEKNRMRKGAASQTGPAKVRAFGRRAPRARDASAGQSLRAVLLRALIEGATAEAEPFGDFRLVAAEFGRGVAEKLPL